MLRGASGPDAQMMLSKMGLGLPKSVLEDPQLFVVKSIDLRQGLERYYQRHYIPEKIPLKNLYV